MTERAKVLPFMKLSETAVLLAGPIMRRISTTALYHD